MGKVKIKPANTIKTRLGVEPNGKAHKLFTQRCYDHIRKYVPGGEKGDLAKNVAVTSSYIVFMSPYAHYQYTGKLYVDPDYNIGAFYSPKYGFWSRRDVKKIKSHRKLTYHTPGTGAKWDKKMISAEMKDVCKEVEVYINGGSK